MNIVIYFICNFFTIFVIHRFFEAFYPKQDTKTIFFYISYLSFFIFTSLAYVLIDIPMIALCLNWILVFLISLTYKSTMQKRMTYTTYIIMFMLVPELIVGAVTGYFHFSVFERGSYSSSIGTILSKIITYIEAFLFKNIKMAKNQQNVSWSSWISSIIIPVATFIYEIILISCSDVTKEKIIISVTIMFMINITTFYIYDSLAKNYNEKSKYKIIEKENELYSKQCEIMQNTTEELQSFRHDMNNYFIAISELMENQRYDEAERQIHELSHITQKKIIYSTSGNVIIDGLINYKLQSALNDNIKIKPEIAIPKNLQIDTADIVTIIGNLIDNALTAIQKVDIDKRFLNLKIVFSQQRLIIRISNPHKENIRCENGKIVTSKKDSHKHGYGISNISKAVDKYNGYMKIDHANGIFTVDILMYI